MNCCKDCHFLAKSHTDRRGAEVRPSRQPTSFSVAVVRSPPRLPLVSGVLTTLHP